MIALSPNPMPTLSLLAPGDIIDLSPVITALDSSGYGALADTRMRRWANEMFEKVESVEPYTSADGSQWIIFSGVSSKERWCAPAHAQLSLAPIDDSEFAAF